jgi:hypothetical protein
VITTPYATSPATANAKEIARIPGAERVFSVISKDAALVIARWARKSNVRPTVDAQAKEIKALPLEKQKVTRN